MLITALAGSGRARSPARSHCSGAWRLRHERDDQPLGRGCARAALRPSGYCAARDDGGRCQRSRSPPAHGRAHVDRLCLDRRGCGRDHDGGRRAHRPPEALDCARGSGEPADLTADLGPWLPSGMTTDALLRSCSRQRSWSSLGFTGSSQRSLRRHRARLLDAAACMTDSIGAPGATWAYAPQLVFRGRPCRRRSRSHRHDTAAADRRARRSRDRRLRIPVGLPHCALLAPDGSIEWMGVPRFRLAEHTSARCWIAAPALSGGGVRCWWVPLSVRYVPGRWSARRPPGSLRLAGWSCATG